MSKSTSLAQATMGTSPGLITPPRSIPSSTKSQKGSQTRPRSSSRTKRSRPPPLSPQSPHKKNIIQTSLYQYPSDSSMVSLYSQQSPLKSSYLDSPRVFTAVIPPLAGVPPTGPLPPTPPPQVADNLERRLSDTLGLIGIDEDEDLNRSRAGTPTKKVAAVVEVLADHSGDDAKKRRGLRRVKGTIAEAATTYKHNQYLEAKAHTPPYTPIRSVRPIKYKGSDQAVHDHGLPTPGSTPPSANANLIESHYCSLSQTVKQIRTFHDYNNNDEDNDVDEDGGITIEYQDHDSNTHQDGEIGNTIIEYDRGKSECPSTPGIPRPDSPFVMGFGFQFDDEDEEGKSPLINLEIEELTTQEEDRKESEWVRLSACRKSYPEFATPVRVNSEKTVIEICDDEVASDGKEELQASITTTIDPATIPLEASPSKRGRPVIPIRRTSTGHRSSGGVPLSPQMSPQEKSVSLPSVAPMVVNGKEVVVVNPDQEHGGVSILKKAVDGAELSIEKSTLARRRFSVRKDAPPSIPSALSMPLPPPTLQASSSGEDNPSQLISDSPRIDSPLSSPKPHTSSPSPTHSKALIIYHPPQSTPKKTPKKDDIQTQTKIQLTSPLLSSSCKPPSIPRFNFIPATPLPQPTPSAFSSKQLGYEKTNPLLTNTTKPTPPPRRSSTGGTVGGPAHNNTPGTRPKLSSRPPTFYRNSKLHPWWKPRSYAYYYDSNYDQQLTQVLSNTPSSFTTDPKTGSRFSEEQPDPDSASVSSKRRRRFSFGNVVGSAAAASNVSLDRKRRVISIGTGGKGGKGGKKVQIEFVGLGGYWKSKKVQKEEKESK